MTALEPKVRRASRPATGRVALGSCNTELLEKLSSHPQPDVRLGAGLGLIKYLRTHPENAGILQAVRRALLRDSHFGVRALARHFMCDTTNAAFAVFLEAMSSDPAIGNRTYLLLKAAKYVREPELAVQAMRSRLPDVLEEGTARRIHTLHSERLLNMMEHMAETDVDLKVFIRGLLKEVKGDVE